MEIYTNDYLLQHTINICFYWIIRPFLLLVVGFFLTNILLKFTKFNPNELIRLPCILLFIITIVFYLILFFAAIGGTPSFKTVAIFLLFHHYYLFSLPGILLGLSIKKRKRNI